VHLGSLQGLDSSLLIKVERKSCDKVHFTGAGLDSLRGQPPSDAAIQRIPIPYKALSTTCVKGYVKSWPSRVRRCIGAIVQAEMCRTLISDWVSRSAFSDHAVIRRQWIRELPAARSRGKEVLSIKARH
jgi:hypothetical protein